MFCLKHEFLRSYFCSPYSHKLPIENNGNIVTQTENLHHFGPISQLLGVCVHWIQLVLTQLCKAQLCKCYLNGLSAMYDLFFGFDPLRTQVPFTWCLHVWNYKFFSCKTQIVNSKSNNKHTAVFFFFYPQVFWKRKCRCSLVFFFLL